MGELEVGGGRTSESLLSLPECKTVLDLLNGPNPNGDGSIEPSRAKEAHSNLERARDVLRSVPELQSATHLLEADLHVLCGEFESAVDAMWRYEHSKKSRTTLGENERKRLQFLRAKLRVYSGEFSWALLEYENLSNGTEREAKRRMRRTQREQKRGGGESLPEIYGAAALNGLGVTNLLLRLRGEASASESGDIVESLETATEMLLDSRKEAQLSPERARPAVDLGLAASISLTNLGVAHRLLFDDGRSRKQSMECWKRGLRMLDGILQDAAISATIIPNWVIQCVESARGRLHCNIACSLLGLHAAERGKNSDKPLDEILREASEAAKKALDISVELIDESMPMREHADAEKDINGLDGSDNSTVSTNDDRSRGRPLSPMWAAYHRAESARALGLVAECHAAAGAAVAAEGLFQSALDASSSYPLGQKLRSRDAAKGVSLSSPNLGLIDRDVRLRYATLLDGWEKRRGDADRLRLESREIEEEGVLKGYLAENRGDGGAEASFVLGLEASLWLFAPSDFER